MKRIILYAAFLCLLVSCQKDGDAEITLMVASEKGECYVVGEFSCYIVKIGNTGNWTTISESIRGFDYEPGYEYVLRVAKVNRKNPPQDYLGEYILRQVVSKVRKNSEGLPSGIIP